MNGIATIAKKEFKTSFKNREFLLIVILFLGMSIASVYIGATTKSAELSAYNDIVAAAATTGAAIPVAPVIYPLAILQNLVEYIIMIGAILAVFLGFDAFNGERQSGTLRLMLTKPVPRQEVVVGKLAGAGLILGALLAATLVFNIGLFIVTTGVTPGFAEVLRVILFLLFAFVYMMTFYMGALFMSIKVRESSYGFLLMMVAWIFISFVIPQLAETQKNFAFAINNVAGTLTQMPNETALSTTIGWFSPAVQFRAVGNDLLQAVTETATISVGRVLVVNVWKILYLFAPGLILLALSQRAVTKEAIL